MINVYLDHNAYSGYLFKTGRICSLPLFQTTITVDEMALSQLTTFRIKVVVGFLRSHISYRVRGCGVSGLFSNNAFANNIELCCCSRESVYGS